MESTKTRILKKLLETDGYLSGQELCEQLGVSRTAVWKYMKQLKEEGYEIEAVQNKGYCLKDVPDVLGESEIKSRLHTRWAGQTLYYYDEIDSTNTQIKRLAEEDAPHGTLAVADYQSRGKGRRGRAWDSPHGSAIYMSILFRPEIRPDRASMLTLVIGLSVTQAIRSNLGLQAQIKWPNDVVLNGKKLVGILTEMSAQMNYIEYLVTGIGINANLREFPEELEDKATSLQKEIGHKVNRSALIAECMEKIEENYEIFVKTQDLSGLMAAYQEALVNQDQQVRVLEPGHEYTGVARGINGICPWSLRICIGGKMYADRIVLCGASAYEQKYYFNPDFDALPQQVKEELQILCVMYTEEIGGILTLEFDEDGNLEFKTEALDADAMYDEIGSVLRIKQIRKEKQELLASLEMYYRVFFLGEEMEDGEEG